MDVTERRERACGEAAEWWERLNAGEMSRAEREEFVDWLRESHVHVAEMLSLAQLHDALGQFDSWARIATTGTLETDNVVALGRDGLRAAAQPTGKPVPASRKALKYLAMAAVIAMLAVAALWMLTSAGTIATGRGERRELALADGSVVQIDPETRLQIDFDSTSRQVRLRSGRALFRVARNPDRPFLVYADETVVRAIGTAFGVERQGGDVVITVSEGKVAVAAGSAPSREEPARGRPGPAETFLAADQQLVTRRRGPAEPVRTVDSKRELAWAEGRLVFNNESVAEAIGKLNRYSHVQLRVADTALAHRTVSGIFDATDPESFVAFLQAATAVRVERDEHRNIMLSSER